MADKTDQHSRPSGDRPTTDAANLIRETLARLRFGTIQLTIHEGRLAQIDVTEKRRFV